MRAGEFQLNWPEGLNYVFCVDRIVDVSSFFIFAGLALLARVLEDGVEVHELYRLGEKEVDAISHALAVGGRRRGRCAQTKVKLFGAWA